MGEALEGLDVAFTDLFAAGLVLLSFIVAVVVTLVARRWVSWRTAVGIGTVAGAWSAFMSAGEILQSFNDPGEQLCPLLAFGLAACLARVWLPWPRARQAGFGVALVVLAFQTVGMLTDLDTLAAGRLTRDGAATRCRCRGEPSGGCWRRLSRCCWSGSLYGPSCDPAPGARVGRADALGHRSRQTANSCGEPSLNGSFCTEP